MVEKAVQSDTNSAQVIMDKLKTEFKQISERESDYQLLVDVGCPIICLFNGEDRSYSLPVFFLHSLEVKPEPRPSYMANFLRNSETIKLYRA